MMLRHLVALLAACVAVTAAATAQMYPEDRSLSPDVYATLGIPSTDHVWSAEDYATAVSVLDSIATADPSALPQYRSAASGALFAHIVSISNVIGVDTAADQVRLNAMVPITEQLSGLLSVYAGPASSGMIFDNELAELFGFVLHTADTLSTLTTRVITAFGQEAMLKDTADADLRQMREGLSATALGAIQFLNVIEPLKISPLRIPARRRLADHLAAHVPAFASMLMPSGRAEIRTQLEVVLGVETDKQVRNSLRKLDQSLAPKAKPAKTRKKSKRK